MKLPFSFGSRLLFRILIPGWLLASSTYPAVKYVSALYSVEFSAAVYFSISPIILGWLMILLDMNIYMFAEGRRYWPSLLKKFGLFRERKKLEKWMKLANDNEHSRRQEASVRAYRYPISFGRYPPTSDQPSVMMPTELGNVIYGFETYPMTKYGLDGVFFWPRIWMGLPKDLRDELDELQSIADSAVYAFFALICGALFFGVYALLNHYTNYDIVKQTSATTELIISALSLLASLAMYRLSVETNSAFGERVKAMFDMKLDQINFEPALEMVSLKTNHNFEDDSEPERRLAAWRYLRWHAYRPSNSSENVDIEQFSSKTKDSG